MLNPPPEETEDIKDIEMEVIELPSSNCKHPLDCATNSKMSRMMFIKEVATAVGVGNDDMNERSESIGVDNGAV